MRLAARRDGPVRRAVIDIARVAGSDWQRAPDRVARALREARGLASAERRFVAEAVHALIRMRRRLAFEAGVTLEGAPAGPATGEVEAKLLDAWLDPPADAEERLGALADRAERLGVRHSYPDWMVARLLGIFDEVECERLLAAMNLRAPLTVRANPLRCTREQLRERLAGLGIESRPTELSALGLHLDTRRNVYELLPFREGWMELQDEGSQLIAEVVAPPPRGSVIDACAGAGGKTLALGAALANRGRVLAFDVSAPKLAELRRRVRRSGLSNVHAVRVAEGPPPGTVPAARVLVDAPCSGSGVVRRNPETRWRLRPGDLDELPRKQRAILEAYQQLVAPGGRLVYATCSLFPEENEGVMADFLAGHPEFEPVPIKEILGRERALRMGDGRVLRVLPHLHGTDGFYAAVLRRTDRS